MRPKQLPALPALALKASQLREENNNEICTNKLFFFLPFFLPWDMGEFSFHHPEEKDEMMLFLFTRVSRAQRGKKEEKKKNSCAVVVLSVPFLQCQQNIDFFFLLYIRCHRTHCVLPYFNLHTHTHTQRDLLIDCRFITLGVGATSTTSPLGLMDGPGTAAAGNNQLKMTPSGMERTRYRHEPYVRYSATKVLT